MNGMIMASQYLAATAPGNQTIVQDKSAIGTGQSQFNELLASLFEGSQEKDGLMQDNPLSPFAFLMLNFLQANQGEVNGSGNALTETQVDELISQLNVLSTKPSKSTSEDLLLALQQIGIIDSTENPEDQLKEMLKVFHQDNYPNLSKDKQELLKIISEKINSIFTGNVEESSENKMTELHAFKDMFSGKDVSVKISHLQAQMNLHSIVHKKENDGTIQAASVSNSLTGEGQTLIMSETDLGNSQHESFTGNTQGKELVSGSSINNQVSNNASFDRLLTTSSTVWSQDNIQEEMESFIQRHLNVTKLNGSGISEAKITLFPEHLGQVDVKIISHNGVITAQLVTETGFGRELLESQIQQLRNNLSNQGIVVDKIEVSQGSVLSQFDQGKRHQQQQWTGGNPSGNKKHQSDKVSAYDLNMVGMEDDSLYSLQRKPYAYSSVEFSA